MDDTADKYLLDRFVHYRTGIAQIDHEHWLILKLIDGMIIACHNQQKVRAREMMSIYRQHLATEESLMHDLEYPFIKAHVISHNEELSKLYDMVERCDQYPMSKYTREIVMSRLFNHIEHHDLQFFDWVRRMNKLDKIVSTYRSSV